MLKKLFVFIKTHLGLVYLMIAGFVAVLVLISVLSRPPTDTAALISRYQDADLRVGDTIENVRAKGYTETAAQEQGEFVLRTFTSKKNQNLPLLVLTKENTVVEIRHPVTLEENLRIGAIRPLFSGENTLDLFSSAWESAKVFISARTGVAFLYHQYTGTVTEMWLFETGNPEAFLSRHPELSSEPPSEDEEEAHQENYPEYFVTIDEASAEAQTEFRIPEGAIEP